MTTATQHRYIVTDPVLLSGEPIIGGTRTPVRACAEKITSMLNKLIFIAFLASFTLAVPKATWADSTSDAKAAIQAAYNDQNRGYLKLDDKAALSHTAPDFIGGDGKQVLRKPMLIVGIQRLFLSIRKRHGHFERTTSIDKIEVNGSQATVLTKVRIRGVAFVDGNTNKPVVTDWGGGTTKDTWLKTKDGWLQKSYTKLSGTG